METEFGEYLGQFSRDGRWLVYTLDDSGQEQVYVQTVPPSSAKFQISTAGGSRPRWRRDGRELYYVTADRTLMAVPVMLGSTLKQARLSALRTHRAQSRRALSVLIPAYGGRTALHGQRARQ